MIMLNNIVVLATQFPDKTSQVWKLPEKMFQAENEIIWTFEHESEFIILAQLQFLLKSRNCAANLTMPYLPYARQDKAINNAETFALRPFLSMIAQLNFKTVSAFDPHNESVVHEYLNNFVALSPLNEINAAIKTVQPDLICYPDAGARTRYSKIIDFPSSYATKVRDQTTGVILSMQISGDYKDKTILIVDDICDGGMTFINIAAALKDAKEINLYISHGIFSKGTDVLRQAGIKRIFTQYGEIK